VQVGNGDDGQNPSSARSPAWVPDDANLYLAHTVHRHGIRALAREIGRPASTVLRRIRRIEGRREEPLVDAALDRLARHLAPPTANEESPPMTAAMHAGRMLPTDDEINAEARRILRRLSERGAFMAVAAGMERAVVLKEGAGGEDPTRIAVTRRAVAEAFALRDWIAAARGGRVTTYRITEAGRAALKRLLAEAAEAPPGLAEAQTPFTAQHAEWRSERFTGADGEAQQLRRNMAESPLTLLARRRDRSGAPFLAPRLVAAGERLREDFELAQMGPRVAQNWDRFLTGGTRGGFAGRGPGEGPQAARERVARALADLGPGLGDAALRCCCYLEGLEQVEKRMGWAARSGKIVLRIALQRLRRHYEEEDSRGGALIG